MLLSAVMVEQPAPVAETAPVEVSWRHWVLAFAILEITRAEVEAVLEKEAYVVDA